MHLLLCFWSNIFCYNLVMEFFAEYKTIFVILHLIGLALGLGGAMVSDFLFFKFLKDLKLDKHELYVMGLLSSVVWAGLFLLIATGACIYLSDSVKYLASSKFLIKMFIVLAITLNGCVLHFYVKPRLKLIDWKAGLKDSHRSIRKIAFACGSISIISWLLATVLGSLSSIPYKTGEALIAYILIIVFVVIVSQCLEYVFGKYS